MGNNIMVQREQSKLEKAFTQKGSSIKKSKKPKPKTTEEHLRSYADNPGQQIGGRGYLVG